MIVYRPPVTWRSAVTEGSGGDWRLSELSGMRMPQRTQRAASDLFQLPQSVQNIDQPPNCIRTKSYGGHGPVTLKSRDPCRRASLDTMSWNACQRWLSIRNEALATTPSSSSPSALGRVTV